MYSLLGQMAINKKEKRMSLIEDDHPPSCYIIRHERLGRKRKFWTVREGVGDRKLVTAFATKSEASGWIFRKELKYDKVH